jgi:hypothetical protein
MIESVDGITARHEMVDHIRITSAVFAKAVDDGNDRAGRACGLPALQIKFG